MNDLEHKQFVLNQEKLALELYNKYHFLENVLKDENIFLEAYVKEFLLSKYKEEIMLKNRKVCNKRISQKALKPNSIKNKNKQQYLNDITNGKENIDFVICKICGYKGRQLIKHLTCVHKIGKKEYMNLYPEAQLNCFNTNNKIAKKLLIANQHHEENGLTHNNFNNPWGLCGYRKDIDKFVRSTWEANFIRILKYKNINFEYEKRVCLNYNNAKLVYVVDFYLPKYNIYIEIKGKWDKTSLLKTKLFKEQFKNTKLFIIDKPLYFKIEKKYKHSISLWETPKQNIKTHLELYSGGRYE